MSFWVCSIASLLLAQGCNAPATGDSKSGAATAQTLPDEESIMAILYQQRAAEYKALCYQAYNIAEMRVREAVENNKHHDSLAVITDLDETALNNSAFEVREYDHDTTYNSADWEKWCKRGEAGPVPGSVAFFKYADSKKVHIFYISNRDTSDVAATMHNMDSLGFPQVARSHFLFKAGSDGSKQGRRDLVAALHYKVVVLLGDNLIDLDSAYDNQSSAIRNNEVDTMEGKWGKNYIVFPNANYGDWENTLYGFKYTYSVAQKDSIRKSYLYGAKY